MKLAYFRPLQKSAVGHEHVNEKKIETFINRQLIKIKFTLEIVKLQQLLLTKGDRETDELASDRLGGRLQLIDFRSDSKTRIHMR
jgi:hypothetical protein